MRARDRRGAGLTVAADPGGRWVRVQAGAASTKVRGPLLREPRRVGSPVAAAAGCRARTGGAPDLVRRALGGRGEASGRHRPLGGRWVPGAYARVGAGCRAGAASGPPERPWPNGHALGPMVMREASELGCWVGAGWALGGVGSPGRRLPDICKPRPRL